MSDEFDGLDATEKVGMEAALNRCRALAAARRTVDLFKPVAVAACCRL
jgi:hypothetical protein